MNFAGPAQDPKSLINRFVDVRITEAMPNSLRGQLMEECDPVVAVEFS